MKSTLIVATLAFFLSACTAQVHGPNIPAPGTAEELAHVCSEIHTIVSTESSAQEKTSEAGAYLWSTEFGYEEEDLSSFDGNPAESRFAEQCPATMKSLQKLYENERRRIAKYIEENASETPAPSTTASRGPSDEDCDERISSAIELDIAEDDRVAIIEGINQECGRLP